MLAPLEAPSLIKIATLTLIILQFTFMTDVETYSYENRIISKEEYDLLGPYPCPGLYCGRSLVNNSFYSECGKCDRGWRVSNNTHSICEKCTGTPIKNDWFFLAFHVILVIVLHWGFIDFSARRRSFTKEVLFLHTCAFIEVAIAAIITVLVMEPFGEMSLTSCKVKLLQDWYTFFQNPNPNYKETLQCTQEVVYPLYTMIFIFYALCGILMLLFRPLLSSKFLPRRGRTAIYAALYFLPALSVIHAIGGGLLYFSYQYIIFILSVIASACHFAFKLDQEPKTLLMGCFKGDRSTVILLGHWLLHAFGILAITQLNEPKRDLSLLCLIPLPSLFYIATARFSDPENFATDINS